MNKLIAIIAVFISFSLYGQNLDSIKHVEVISEIRDSMVLLNKTDVDKINYVFEDKRRIEKLNEVNDSIISLLSLKVVQLDSIIVSQSSIIKNKDLILEKSELDKNFKLNEASDTINKQKKQLIFWKSTTSVGIISTLILLILL